MRMIMKSNLSKNLLPGLILFISVFIGINAFAQKAVLSLDTSSIRIGERVQIRLNAVLPKSSKVYWPVIPDTISSAIEVASRSKIDTNTTSRQEFVNLSQRIQITSFDTGFHYIPPFKIYYSYTGDTTRHELVSDGAYLKVKMVEVDTTHAIRDIRGNLSAPLTFSELTPYFGAAALIGLIVGFIWYYLWRKRMNKPLFPVIAQIQVAPWQLALENLDLLHSKKLWQQGKIKEYYTELTDILRQYLHQQHAIDAMEMITSEILDAFERTALNTEAKPLLSRLLVQADFAKFAKATPANNENEQSIIIARQFIEATKPAIVQQEEKSSETTEDNKNITTENE